MFKVDNNDTRTTPKIQKNSEKSQETFLGVFIFIKMAGLRSVFRTLSNIYDGVSCENSLAVNYFRKKLYLTEVALQRCSQEKMFRKNAANLQENTHAEVWFQ